MDKNAFLAIILCLVIFLGWSYLFPTVPPKNETVTETNKELITEKSQNQDGTVALQSSTSELTEKKPENSEFLKYEDTQISIDNEYLEAKIGARSGGIYSWKLKKYKDNEGNPIDLASNHELSPLNLSLSHFFTSKSLKDKTFYPFKLVSSSEKELKFEFEGEGIKLVKVYRFVPETYEIKIHFEVESLKEDLTGYLSFVLSERYKPVKGGFLSYQGAPQRFLYSSIDGNTNTIKFDSIASSENLKEDLNTNVFWLGSDEQYFLSALITQNQKSRVWVERNEDIIKSFLQLPLQGKKTELEFSLFKGPKDKDILDKVYPNLSASIDYGWFKVVALPLLYLLKFFYGLIRNYGIAIILLTVFVKIILHPLTHKSFKSMKEMQRIQPQLNKIREKFKDDKEKLNREMMALMKSNKVNPMGGCFPMLLQFPVFIALYRVLGNSIELRGAPFIFWIADLSQKDKFYVLPLLTGLVTFIQQKNTPTMGDPTQAKMMMMMPVFMTSVLLFLPSGLTLYIFVNAVLTFAQQYFINRPIQTENTLVNSVQ